MMSLDDMVVISIDEYNELLSWKNQLMGEFTELGWIPPEEKMTVKEWLFNMEAMVLMHRASNFWIGDHIIYGEWAYGEKYAQALPDPYAGYDPGTLRNIVWVCGKVPLSLRNDKLLWSHYVAVAPYEHAVIERLLEMTMRHCWKVSQLRGFINRWHRIFGERPVRATIGRPSTPGPSASLPLYTATIVPEATISIVETVVKEIEHYIPAPAGEINMVKHARRVMRFRRLARVAWEEVESLREKIDALRRENDELYDQIVELQASRLDTIRISDDDWAARIKLE